MPHPYYELECLQDGSKWIVPQSELNYEVAFYGPDNVYVLPLSEEEIEIVDTVYNVRRRTPEEVMTRDLVTALKQWRDWMWSEYSECVFDEDPDFVAIVDRHHLRELVKPACD